jgi:hypothetical protein
MAQPALHHVGIVLSGPEGALQKFVGIIVLHEDNGKTILAVLVRGLDGGQSWGILKDKGEKTLITFLRVDTQNLV